MGNVGVFGGSFNPIHIGHLVIAEAAWQEFRLDKVIFVPTGDTPGKSMHHISKEDRYEMVRLSIEGNPRFTISRIEMDREGPSYTVDTIRQLRREMGNQTELYFIAGTDAVADLPSWKYNRELLESCHFICASRPGSEEELKSSVEFFGDLGREKIHFLRTPELDISSTLLRQWIRRGRSTRYFIPMNVLEYISAKELYSEDE